MKKLLLVLAVVAMASFLFVGCFGVTPTPTPTPPEPEPEVAVCPTVAVSDSVIIGTKTYLKAAKHTITVTFAVPTEPVSVYIGKSIKTAVGVPSGAEEVVMYTTDKKVYTGTWKFGSSVWDFDDCNAGYIYVATCDTCAPCKTAFTVDSVGPYAQLKATVKACDCATGDQLKITSDWKVTAADCAADSVGCCDDYCSGLASWTLDIYDEDPYGVCCAADPCVAAYKSCTGTACPVECITECDKKFFVATADWASSADNKVYYILASLTDKVGNKTTYTGKLVVDTDSIVGFDDVTLGSIDCAWGANPVVVSTLGIGTCP